ncbi:hypothetical protein [Exiguobacterium chiriqhucha]|uniref:Uncharacterized protein n=1 Tax=Exiguobacterium chiriqhucha RW-2 TaxID=1345023 RepID=U1N653_9BACL|nr:hypothetical protein [Exiguobacterium chiriqhucha]ERG68030.1 hypothetical protein M467_12135 [Exiguobacterium chiriqhucha RW-2]
MADIYENDNIVSSMEPLLELINDINSQAQIQDHQISRISELTEIYNRLRRLYTSDYTVSAIHATELDTGSFELPNLTMYDVGNSTGYTINKLSIFTGDIIETPDGKEGMIVEHSSPIAPEFFFVKDPPVFKLIMKDRTVVINKEDAHGSLTLDGSTQLKLTRPYYLFKDHEEVIFDKNDTQNNLFISLNKRKRDNFFESDRRFDEETTDEMIRQLFPEYFD